MLLRCTTPKDAADEKELRQWLVDQIGEEDQRILTEWVWDNHNGGVGYVDALAAIVRQTDEHGPQFLRNLLDFAKKPKEQREAEQELIEWMRPRVLDAVAIVRGHRGDEQVAKEEFHSLCYKLEEKLCNMFPGKHRATMKGAMLSAFKRAGGGFSFDAATLVKILQEPDPLASTAAASRG